LVLEGGFDFLFNIFFLLIDTFNDFISFLLGDISFNSLIYLIFQLFLLLLHLQRLHLLLLILTFHLLSDGAFVVLGLLLLVCEKFLLTGKNLLHFLLEIEVFVALDGLVIFDSLRVKLNEGTDNLAGRRF
jgi:hypothetical protein